MSWQPYRLSFKRKGVYPMKKIRIDHNTFIPMPVDGWWGALVDGKPNFMGRRLGV